MGRVWRLTDSSQCALAAILDVCRPIETVKNGVGYTGEQGGDNDFLRRDCQRLLQSLPAIHWPRTEQWLTCLAYAEAR